MTGVEAVSNGVQAFREPVVPAARHTLTAIIAILVVLLLGIAYLAHAYNVGATHTGNTTLPKCSISTDCSGRRPRNLLLDQYDVDSSGAVLVREYFIR
jgi:hypothetical protein